MLGKPVKQARARTRPPAPFDVHVAMLGPGDFLGAHTLVRKIRIEEDLVDQFFNSSEKRLARTLLLIARYGKEDTTQRTLPKLSQET